MKQNQEYTPTKLEVLREMGKMAKEKLGIAARNVGKGFYDGAVISVKLWHTIIPATRTFRAKIGDYEDESINLPNLSKWVGLGSGLLGGLFGTGFLYDRLIQKTGSDAALLVPVLTSQAASLGYEFYKYARNKVIEKANKNLTEEKQTSGGLEQSLRGEK